MNLFRLNFSTCAGRDKRKFKNISVLTSKDLFEQLALCAWWKINN